MRYIFFIFLLMMVFVFYNNSGGRAAVADSGNTGAPGDETLLGNSRTCVSCHNSGEIQVDLLIEVKDSTGSVVTSYTGGLKYTVQVSITPKVGNPSGYGFQMISLLDRDSSDVAGWLNPAPNVKLVTTTNDRFYAEHNGPSLSNIFEVDWLAPAPGSGSITFYTAGNGVNRNGDNTGDGAAITSFSITEDFSTSIVNKFQEDILIYPNPASTFVIVSSDQEFDYSLFNSTGQMVKSGLTGERISLRGISPGTYFLLLDNPLGIRSSHHIIVRN